MTQVTHNQSRTPKQAARRRARVDKLLDAELFKALSDPTRLALLTCLIKCGRPCSVTEVAECCSVDFSVVARHLAALARVGVLRAEKKGRTHWYVAPSAELSARFREIGSAIDEWSLLSTGCEECACDA